MNRWWGKDGNWVGGKRGSKRKRRKRKGKGGKDIVVAVGEEGVDGGWEGGRWGGRRRME